MPLPQMSLRTAEKVSDLYISLTALPQDPKSWKVFKYSRLLGYDYQDVKNAFCILVAYRLFIGKTRSDIEETAKYADLATVSLMSFSIFFAPDHIAEQISQIDKSKPESALKFFELKRQIPKVDNLTSETVMTFYEYCCSLGSKDPAYWQKVYQKLGISWEVEDEDDEITALIEYEKYRERLVVNEKKLPPKQAVVENAGFVGESGSKRKGLLNDLVAFSLLAFSYYYTPAKIYIFSLFALFIFIKLCVWISHPIEQKFFFGLILCQFLFFIGALFYRELTLYPIAMTVAIFIIGKLFSLSPEVKPEQRYRT